MRRSACRKRMLRGTQRYGNRPLGLTVCQLNFIKCFGRIYLLSLLEHRTTLMTTGQLSVTQRRGIFKLIPKKDAEPFFIKTWRPLTPLNCDYKIAAKPIANRLKPSLPSLINYDQTGFIKGRFVGENIHLIGSVICHAKEKNIPGLLLFLHFEKAFDTMEWSFIRTLWFW